MRILARTFGTGWRVLCANRCSGKIGHLLKLPVGRPALEVRRYCASFRYQARSWNQPRHVVAKIECHPGELYPGVGLIVTNLARSAQGIVAFYNRRGTCEQHIKKGKNAINSTSQNSVWLAVSRGFAGKPWGFDRRSKWTRLSCRIFAAIAVRRQLHALAYNLGNFMRTLAMPKAVERWSTDRVERHPKGPAIRGMLVDYVESTEKSF